MFSYLSLLDSACLFELLIRLSYPDLRSILAVNPRLYRITNTKLFNETWKKYNITIVETKFVNGFTLKAETDMFGIKHGTSYDYGQTGDLWFQKEYIQGKIVSVCEWPNQCIVRRDYVYFDGVTYKISEVRHAETNDLISRSLQRDSYRAGSEWEYSASGSISLWNYALYSYSEPSLRVLWFPSGIMHYMRTKLKECCWWPSGIKRYDNPLNVHGRPHGIAREWNEQGELTRSVKYNDGIGIS